MHNAFAAINGELRAILERSYGQRYIDHGGLDRCTVNRRTAEINNQDSRQPLEWRPTMKLTSTTLLSAAAIATVFILAPAPARAQTAAATYQAKCVSCHAADGKGNPALVKQLGVRDFASPEVQKETDAELTTITANGKNKMPGYAKTFKPEQIKDLVAYVRELGKK
jgi:mono/diheme cytochrome c family protein